MTYALTTEMFTEILDQVELMVPQKSSKPVGNTNVRSERRQKRREQAASGDKPQIGPVSWILNNVTSKARSAGSFALNRLVNEMMRYESFKTHSADQEAKMVTFANERDLEAQAARSMFEWVVPRLIESLKTSGISHFDDQGVGYYLVNGTPTPFEMFGKPFKFNVVWRNYEFDEESIRDNAKKLKVSSKATEERVALEKSVHARVTDMMQGVTDTGSIPGPLLYSYGEAVCEKAESSLDGVISSKMKLFAKGNSQFAAEKADLELVMDKALDKISDILDNAVEEFDETDPH